mmetsp:Transcript_24064/g.35602  ORF Transcript_24064/g.35602 Transcript_24064/m.35602 type:complete len:268 (-) Transcript_24064:1357-2160(-)
MEGEDTRAALQHAVAQICTDEMHDGTSMTKGAIQTLSELTYMYATTCLSNDLVAFARHANRRTITPDDIMLVARKNPNDLIGKLKEFAEANDCFTQSLSSTRKTLADKRVTSPTRDSQTKKKRNRKVRGKQETLPQDTESDCSSRGLSEPRTIAESRRKSCTLDSSDTDGDRILEMQKSTLVERYTVHEKKSPHFDHSHSKSIGWKRKNGIFQQEVFSTDEEDDPPLSTLKKSRLKKARENTEKAKKKFGKNEDFLSSSDDESTFET